MGRLHTRYSPVRRSPPASYPAALPLDLHVLSLSLAFILSQDQTLRCCLSFFLFFSDKKHRPFSPDRWLLLDGGFRPLCLSCLTVALFQCPLCSSEPLLRRLARRPRFGVASAKVQQILLPTKLFRNFFMLKNIFFCNQFIFKMLILFLGKRRFLHEKMGLTTFNVGVLRFERIEIGENGEELVLIVK